MIAALFIDPRGPYMDLEGVDPWPESRDARSYQGPHPVIYPGVPRLGKREAKATPVRFRNVLIGMARECI